MSSLLTGFLGIFLLSTNGGSGRGNGGSYLPPHPAMATVGWSGDGQLTQVSPSMVSPGSFFFFFFFNLLFIYLFLCLAALGLCFWARAFLVAAIGGHCSSRCMGLSLSRPLLLRSTGSSRAGSVVVAHRPSCFAAYGIFPDQGSNPCPLHWQADSQPLCHQGSPSWEVFF